MNDKIGWGILGPGTIAKTFAHCLREVPDSYIAAVGSRSLPRSREFTEVFGGTPYGSYEEMLADHRVDVVYVATPHHLHEEHVLLCAHYKKHILCEKPFAINERQARNMYKAAAENGVFLMDGLWSRFFPAWEYAAELVRDGSLGRLFGIISTTSWGSKKDPQDRLFNKALAGGALLDAGIYSLAIATLLLGTEYPDGIKAYAKIGDTGVDEHDTVLLDYASGPFFSMMCGMQGYLHETNIVLEKGSIRIPRHRNPARVIVTMPQVGETWQSGDIREIRFPYVDEGFQFEARHVQDCIRHHRTTSPRVTPEESILLMRISDEIRRQANLTYPFE